MLHVRRAFDYRRAPGEQEISQFRWPFADRFWSGFCRALGLEELESDVRFDPLATRAENNQTLIRIIEERIATKTRIEWADSLDNENCIWAPVQTLDEVIVDPQVKANGFITSVDHPSEGAY